MDLPEEIQAQVKLRDRMTADLLKLFLIRALEENRDELRPVLYSVLGLDGTALNETIKRHTEQLATIIARVDDARQKFLRFQDEVNDVSNKLCGRIGDLLLRAEKAEKVLNDIRKKYQQITTPNYHLRNGAK